MNIPLGRAGTPQYMAEFMLFVASENLKTVFIVNCGIKFLDESYVSADIILNPFAHVEKLML